MLFCFHKYLLHPSKTKNCKEEDNDVPKMVLPSAAGGPQPPESGTSGGCCFSPFLPPKKENLFRENTDSNPRSRSNFAKLTISSLFPNPHFTNHESIFSLTHAFSNFTATFPQYYETQHADDIRERDYSHLSDHICFDYNGVNLFSHTQMSNPSAPFFSISYKSTSLRSEIKYGEEEKGFEFAVRRRIMSFLKVSEEEYGMVCTANRTAAFRLLAETYPFDSSKKLLTVYDYESEAVRVMVESAGKRGAKVMSSRFCWPNLRINSTKLKKMLGERKEERKKRGLFVFPHMSRVSGVRYPYLWLKFARENGWDVVLDACTVGPKDMDTFGIRLIQPDFIICSFFKVFGENPSGFAGLFIKKSSFGVLQTSVLERSIGIVSIVRAQRFSDFAGDEDDTTRSFSGPIPVSSKDDAPPVITVEERQELELSSEIVEEKSQDNQLEVEFSGLDHADSLGLITIHNRLRCLTNWLIIALMKLQHPPSKNGSFLVKIYGPQVKFDRGPALAFNVFDWKGEKISPLLVQKLADRNNISLSCGFLHHIIFSEKYEQVKHEVLEERVHEFKSSGNKTKGKHNLGISVVNASFCYLANFEDFYRLWAFVAKFLDADFVEKERWRYMALNQTIIEL